MHKAPADMTDEEAQAALSDPHYTGNHDLLLELRDRLTKVDPAYHGTKGLDPDYEVPEWAKLIS